MAYLDPPFNTGRPQARRTLATVADVSGDRTGFGGRRYATRLLEESSYRDAFDDYLGFLEPRLREVRRLLSPEGTLYFHIDCREAHYCKLALDELFGRECFLNELIWAYDYGAKPRNRWPAKHDTILVYVKDPDRYLFDCDAVDREPYMAPGLVTPAQRERGKRPSDTWWHTIVSPTGREKTGYPTQKPEGIVRRMVQASSRPRGLRLAQRRRGRVAGVVLARDRVPVGAAAHLAECRQHEPLHPPQQQRLRRQRLAPHLREPRRARAARGVDQLRHVRGRQAARP